MTVKVVMGFIFLSMGLLSCVPQHKIIYVQSSNEKTNCEYPLHCEKALLIQPHDMLYITVSSLDQPGYNFFNQEKQNYNTISDATLNVLSYTVNEKGFLSLPVLGEIKAKGLTTVEVAKAISDSVKHMLNNPMVAVRFVNSNITILGEVTRPGTYSYTNENLSLFRAIGLAGDVTEYGDRRQVILIRENEKRIHKYKLDLTRDDLFQSEYYYLRPNDILYVQPMKIRRFGMKEYPFALVVSAVTSAFLVLYYVKK
jgi:polysaccharide export outer membrane protein